MKYLSYYMNKILLLALSLLFIAPVTAASIDITVVTNNGSVTLAYGANSSLKTYLCSDFKYDTFSINYDTKISECQQYLTNITCGVQNLECKIPDDKLNALRESCVSSIGLTKEELKNTLPGLIITQANLTTLVDLNNKVGLLQGENQILRSALDGEKFHVTILGVFLIFFGIATILLIVENETEAVSRILMRKKDG